MVWNGEAEVHTRTRTKFKFVVVIWMKPRITKTPKDTKGCVGGFMTEEHIVGSVMANNGSGHMVYKVSGIRKSI